MNRLRALLRRLFRRRDDVLCGDLLMFPYWTADEFGYRDWSCRLAKGHAGDHFGQNPLAEPWRDSHLDELAEGAKR